MSATDYTLDIVQGATRRASFGWPQVLAEGMLARLAVASVPGGEPLLEADSDDGTGRVVLSDADVADGEDPLLLIDVTLDDADTAALPYGSARWDLFVGPPVGESWHLLTGAVHVARAAVLAPVPA